jgi:hypothetical protein
MTKTLMQRVARAARWAATGLALAAAAQPLTAQTPEADAQRAAEAWLALVDSTHYAESWTQAAAAFRAAVTQGTWDSTMTSVRAPLGAARSRELLGAQYSTSLPNAPPGEYVLLQFRTVFAGRETPAIETVVPMKDPDGAWRVSGYFIR